MIVERVTREHVRALKVGEMGVYVLPSYKAVMVASSVFSIMKRLEGIECERVPTNEPLTIAYKRIK